MDSPVTSAFQSRPLQIFLILAVVVGLIYYLGRKAGLAKAEESVIQLPDSGSGIPKGWSPKPLAAELYRVLKGVWTLAGTKEIAIYNVYNLPTADMLAAVNNQFNHDYLGEGSGTLVKWLEDEQNVAIGGTRNKLVARLKSIGAK
jgi:hypothetical protein